MGESIKQPDWLSLCEDSWCDIFIAYEARELVPEYRKLCFYIKYSSEDNIYTIFNRINKKLPKAAMSCKSIYNLYHMHKLYIKSSIQSHENLYPKERSYYLLSSAIRNHNANTSLTLLSSMLARGLSPNRVSPQDNTAVAWAVRLNKLNILKLLIRYGGNLCGYKLILPQDNCHFAAYDKENKETKINLSETQKDILRGSNSLHLAAFGGFLEMIKYLVEECHMNPYKRNPQGLNAFDLAKDHPKAIEYLTCLNSFGYLKEHDDFVD